MFCSKALQISSKSIIYYFLFIPPNDRTTMENHFNTVLTAYDAMSVAALARFRASKLV
jgi:hypothetical protein